MSTMSVERERDILHFFVKEVLRNKGVNFHNHEEVRRELGNLAKKSESRFSAEELYSILRPITMEVVMETLPEKL